jgi:hypothetical protein
MVLPGFTAEASISNGYFGYLLHRSGNMAVDVKVLPEQMISDGPGCNPHCGPCRDGVKLCITRNCDEVERSCNPTCKPECGPCIDFSKECTRSDCTEYRVACCPCQEAVWCESGATLVHRYCDCSVTYEPDSGYCTGPI